MVLEKGVALGKGVVLGKGEGSAVASVLMVIRFRTTGLRERFPNRLPLGHLFGPWGWNVADFDTESGMGAAGPVWRLVRQL